MIKMEALSHSARPIVAQPVAQAVSPSRPLSASSPVASSATERVPNDAVRRERHRWGQNIPAMPAVVQDIMRAIEKPNANITQIALQLSRDQSLSAKVLRLANSVVYGGTRKIASVNDAVIVVGLSALRTLLLSCGLSSAIRIPPGFDIQAFWQHSFRIAQTSRIFARMGRLDGEIAFTCGLLHNIGSLITYVDLNKRGVSYESNATAGESQAVYETNVLGYCYVDVGIELATRWRFPEAIVAGIADQEAPLQSTSFSPMAGIVWLSRQLLEGVDAGLSLNEQLDAVPVQLLQALRIRPEQLRERFDEWAVAQSADAAAMMS